MAQERTPDTCQSCVKIAIAIEKGHKFMQVFEVWHFPNKSGNLLSTSILGG